jgi:hypothetical protein
MPLFDQGSKKLLTGEIDWLNNIFLAILTNKKDFIDAAQKKVDEDNRKIILHGGEFHVGLKDFLDWNTINLNWLEKFNVRQVFVRNTTIDGNLACADPFYFECGKSGTYDSIIIIEKQTETPVFVYSFDITAIGDQNSVEIRIANTSNHLRDQIVFELPVKQDGYKLDKSHRCPKCNITYLKEFLPSDKSEKYICLDCGDVKYIKHLNRYQILKGTTCE